MKTKQPTRRFVCVGCEYDLRGLKVGGVCPECGRAVIETLEFRLPNAGFSERAMTSLSLGAASVMLFFFFGLPSLVLGVLAVWLGREVRASVRREEAGGASDGIAKAGIISGLVGGVLGFLLTLFWAWALVF